MNKKTIQGNASWVVFIVCSVLYFSLWFYQYGGNNIASDGVWYYEYFVRIFINQNLQGSGLIKYPVGTTILELPFLYITLCMCKAFNIDLEAGQNIYFQKAVFISALFYFILGMYMLYRLVKEKYSSATATLVCVCLTYGTMLPVYICERSSFSHIYGFFICTLFFYYISIYEKHTGWGNRFLPNIGLGFILGFSVIIRNTDVIIGAIYLFYGVNSLRGFVTRLKERILKPRIFVQLLGFAVIYAVQMLFWKIMTGEWILYSYGGESFLYAKKPQILDVLFSDGKGLFIYCPVLIIAIIGMIAFRRENKEVQVAQWVIFAGVTYFISAWWCWWLGCAYGERMYCDVLCIFALPLGAFFENLHLYKMELGEKITLKRYIPIICYIITAFFVVLNLVWIRGTRSGMLSDNIGTWYELNNSFFDNFIR